MAEFFDIIFSLPTAIFTWPLMVVTVYWAVAIAGLFDIHWFEGAGAAVEGSVEGAVEGAVDGAIDGAADSLADRLASVGDAAFPEGTLESAPVGAETMPGAWNQLSLGGLPRSFTGSLMILFGWTFSVLASYLVPGYGALATRGLWLALLLAAVTLGLAYVATALAVRPLRKAMEAGYGPERRDLLGQVCTVTTQRVDARFGQAELDDGSSLIQVRSRQATDLTRGSRAVIFDYDAEQEIFWVAPVELEA